MYKRQAFGVPTIVTGLALMVVTALIVIGGLKRVAAVTEKLVQMCIRDRPCSGCRWAGPPG